MIVLSCKNIQKSFGIDVVLEDVTFSLNEGDKVGLIGPNGAGKSTLFRILTGETSQDSGEIFIDKGKTIGYLSQHLSLDNDSTIYSELEKVFSDLLRLENKIKLLEQKMNEPYDSTREDLHNKVISDYTTACDLFESRGGYTYKAEISKVLLGLGFINEDFDKSINILSGGQKTRVALCKLLLTKPSVILLDEPTNHLDLDAIEWLEDYLKSYKGTVLVISHDRYFLDSVTNYTYEMIQGKIKGYAGNYTKFIDLRKKEYEVELKAYNLQQAEIKRQEKIIEKYRSFNREKSIKAAESREKALEKIERLEAPVKEGPPTRISFKSSIQSGNDVLHIDKLSKGFDERVLFHDISFDLKRTDKVALIGQNGIGKTTLFKIILEKIRPDTGVVSIGRNVNIGYYDQEQSDLNMDKTVIDEVWDDFPEMTTTEVRNALAAFLFIGDDVFKQVSNLSGGERCRINLLKLMLYKNNFLLLDEPTNHLDIASREALEDAILDYDGTLLVISHDRYFLNKIATKIFELEPACIKEYLGNYSYYIEKKKNPNRFDIIDSSGNGVTKTKQQEEKRKKREQEKKLREEKKRVKDIEEAIAKNEEELKKLNEALCLEEVYSNPEKSQEVNKQIQQLQEAIDGLYEEWEELM
ncbi:ABC-F family ATP-binding cassette domain-containing protein [Clostridium oryzae]|uniref:Putative ABC transporter ATP-binding protein YheS n=1 Tax=Clostridium oryzae TaxID=1450648 RepID=A0A1V4INW8_9CLOT|nr:ABC-F family ATP-binding cassette domain-containing protein [Clostridium oryzae]OPJ61534.1 putative ABC transporter ATP-binding protein YheS [Clostridium oryzae]